MCRIFSTSTPPLTADGSGIALGPTAPGGGEVKVTGKVKASAAAGAEFFFTCGFGPHNGPMVTRSFKIGPDGQPARQIEIVAAPHDPPPPGGWPSVVAQDCRATRRLHGPSRHMAFLRASQAPATSGRGDRRDDPRYNCDRLPGRTWRNRAERASAILEHRFQVPSEKTAHAQDQDRPERKTTAKKKTASGKKSGKKKASAKSSAKKLKAAFEPAEMGIPLNDRVFWFNADTKTHQINLTGEELAPGKTSSEIVITARSRVFLHASQREKGTIKVKS